MITHEIAEQAVTQQTLLGARPIATKTAISSLFDTFKVKENTTDTIAQADLVTTVTEIAEHKSSSIGYDGVDSVPFDVLATRRFTRLNREDTN